MTLAADELHDNYPGLAGKKKLMMMMICNDYFFVSIPGAVVVVGQSLSIRGKQRKHGTGRNFAVGQSSHYSQITFRSIYGSILSSQ